MNGFPTALRAELFVALRSLPARVTVALPAIAVLIQLVLSRLRGAGQQAREAFPGQGGADFAAGNAWGHYVDSLLTGLTLLSLAMVAYTAWTFASERDSGAIRHLLIRASSRRALLLAKLAGAHIIALLSLLLMLVMATAASAWFWEFGPVVEDGYELIGSREIREEFRLGLTLALLPLPAAISFATLIAVLSRTATQAVTTALGATLALDIFKGMLGNASQYLYATFQPSLIDQSYLNDVSRLVRGYSDVLLDPSFLQLNQWVPLPQMLLFLLLSLVLITRRRL